MVPAMLSGSGVTIVVAPYAELKRQLVTRCIGAGLDCKHWPEAWEKQSERKQLRVMISCNG